MSSRKPRPMDNDPMMQEARRAFVEERFAIRVVDGNQSEEEARRGAVEDWERYIRPPWQARLKLEG